MGLRLAISLIGIVLSLEGALWSGPITPSPGTGDVRAAVPAGFVDQWADHLYAERARQDAVTAASRGVRRGADAAGRYQALPRDEAALDDAARDVRLGHLARGRETAERVLEVPQPASVTRRAHDIAAFTASRTEDHAAVVEHTEPELDDGSGPTLAGYRALWRGEALEAMGHHSEAMAAATAARDHDSTSPVVHRARILRAVASAGVRGREMEGVRAIERELDRYPEYPYRDRLTLVMATAELAADRVTAAARRLDTFIWERPFSRRAPDAAALLADAIARGATPAVRSAQDHLTQGRLLRLERHWETAEVVLQTGLDMAVSGRPRSGLVNEIRFQLALNAYDSARFDVALARMEEIEDAGGVGVSLFNRHTWSARSLSRLGREDEAYAALDAYYVQRSASERSHRMFEMAFDMGMWDTALTHLDALHGADRDWRNWEGAFTLYLAGHHAESAALFDGMAARASGPTAARYSYWRARSLEHTGDVAEALDVYRELAASMPHHYYGLQASNRLAEWLAVRPTSVGEEDWTIPVTPGAHPGRVHWYGIDGPPRAGWSELREPEPDSFFAGYPDELVDETALHRLVADWRDLFPAAATAKALHDIGAEEEARKVFRDPLIEFRALDALATRGRIASRSRPVRLAHLRWEHFIDNRSQPRGWWGIDLVEPRYPVPSRSSDRAAFADRQAEIARERDRLRPLFRAAARQLGDYYMVRRFALDEDLPPVDDEPLDPRWHEAYPRAYGPELREAVERYDMNPYLVWALMIVESDMNPDTVSRADAYGLLQVIPKTGELVAIGFGERDFGIHELLDAEASLRFGTWYLNELLEKFDGQEMLAMVAYNAGPHQVARWLQWRGEGMAMDEFIETVPYNGARRYPQRILQYVSLMRSVNGLDPSVYVGNVLDPHPQDNIYY